MGVGVIAAHGTVATCKSVRAVSIALSGGIAALIKAVPTLAGEGGGSTAGTIAL